jgi:carbamoyl-phosphate synthase large subunit
MDALRHSGLSVRIIAADSDPLASGLFMAERGHVLPLAKDPNFIGEVLKICLENRVDIIMPIYSAELPVFSRHADDFRKRGIRLCVASEESLSICDDKLRTIEFFNRKRIACPWTRTSEEVLQAPEAAFPLFMKQRQGSGSKGTHLVSSRSELQQHLTKGQIVQEYVDGEEYTVDVVADLSGRMIAASPRLRNRIYGGLSSRGTTVQDAEIVKTTKEIVEALALPGASNVQCKRTLTGQLKFIEVNPRFASGGLPLAVAAGLNIPEIVVRLLMNWPLPDIEIRPGIIMNRYWSSQFLRKVNGKEEYEVLD